MPITKRVIHLAKERALFKFSTMAHHMVQETESSIVASLATTQSQADKRMLVVGRDFLRQQGKPFLKRLDELFCDNLERAMRTMYTDLRKSLSNLSAESMTLIDDETVNRQIEVGRLVQRMHETDEENLSRLNIIVAQLHEDKEVRERENPFRPYLMARALHDALIEMEPDELVAKFLYEEFGNGMLLQLPEYYTSIRDVFESSGLHARLMAQPSRETRSQRYRHAQQHIIAQTMAAQSALGGNSMLSANSVIGGMGPDAALTGFQPQMLPNLHRLMALMQQMPMASGAATGAAPFMFDRRGTDAVADAPQSQDKQAEALQDFVWRLFNQAGAVASQPTSDAQGSLLLGDPSAHDSVTEKTLAAVSQELIARLNQYQHMVAGGQAVNDQLAPEQNQLFAVRDMIGSDSTSVLERVAIDVVAMLFDFMLADAQIPPALRGQIGRLQIPFLKAAMLEPDMLHQADHPARQLLNRMSSAVVGVDPATPMGEGLAAEVNRLVAKVLDEFDEDPSVFADALKQLEAFLATYLRHADSETERSVEAVEEAETLSTMLDDATISLQILLTPLSIDPRVTDFAMKIWVRVLAQAAVNDAAAASSENPPQSCTRYREVLPDLIWSAQEKQSAAERNELMRLLPKLVVQLKVGMQLIRLSPEESKQALDQLVDVHTQVLRTNAATDAPAPPSLEHLRQHFSGLVVDRRHMEVALEKPVAVPASLIEAALTERGVDAKLDLEREIKFSCESDADWLRQMQAGTLVERWSGDAYQTARVAWVSKRESLYMFKLEPDSKLIVYSSASLIQALREGSVRLVEYAPAFERAVDSLIIGAEALKPPKDDGDSAT